MDEKGERVTWCRERRDGAGGVIGWESFDACFDACVTIMSAKSSNDDSCNKKVV